MLKCPLSIRNDLHSDSFLCQEKRLLVENWIWPSCFALKMWKASFGHLSNDRAATPARTKCCVEVPSPLPLANSYQALRLDYSRIMCTSLLTFDSCIKIIQSSSRLQALPKQHLFLSSELQGITKPLHPSSLRSCFMYQLLVVPPMYRRILRRTWYRLQLFPLLHTQRLRHKILLPQMSLRLAALL